MSWHITFKLQNIKDKEKVKETKGKHNLSIVEKYKN